MLRFDIFKNDIATLELCLFTVWMQTNYLYPKWSFMRLLTLSIISLSNTHVKSIRQCHVIIHLVISRRRCLTRLSRHDSCHFADDILLHFREWKLFCILIKISPKFVHKRPTEKSPALVKIMTWHRIGDQPLSEPMLTRFIYMRHREEMS